MENQQFSQSIKNFHNDKILKEGSQCICLSVILTDSVYRKDKNSYPQVFLEDMLLKTICCKKIR